MRGVDHQHGVEFEAHRPRLHVTHAGQQQRGQHFAIARAAFDAAGDFFEQPVARRFFQQAHQRFDFRLKAHDLRVDLPRPRPRRPASCVEMPGRPSPPACRSWPAENADAKVRQT